MLGQCTYFAGGDIGTTGCRVSFYDSSGKLVVTSSGEYPLEVPGPGLAEQDPELIYRTFTSTFMDALARFPHPRSEIRAIGLSTVFHSVIPVSAKGEAMHAMLTFADTRAQSVLGHLRSAVDEATLYTRTGCPLHPMYPLAKIEWFRRERPEIFAAAHKFVSIKEFIVHRLTGKYLVDLSIASGTGLFDIHRLAWNEESLRAVGIGPEKLSTVESTTHSIDDWSSEALGLPKGVALVLGAGDGVLSTLGAGAVGPGQYTAMIGTSGAVRLCSDKPLTDPRRKNWCYLLTESSWVVGGAINNGGLALRWLRDEMFPSERQLAEKSGADPYARLIGHAETVPAGADGLLFLPFLSGERSPHWNANARGVLFGLTLQHGMAHVTRATLEGILYSMYSVFRSLEQLPGSGRPVREIRASGSFTRSALWLQMMADVFGHPIVVPGEPQGSVFGAAAMAMLATGNVASTAEIRDLVGAPVQTFAPRRQERETYERLFAIYGRVYESLIGEFDEISRLQSALRRESDARASDTGKKP